MSKGKIEYNHLFMIVMIGDSSVGKSCLLKKFVEPESQMSYNDNHMATVGVDFIVRTINVDGQLVKLQVWDTAGQERFRSVTSAYYRGAMGAIVCYDSLEEPTWRNTETWMSEFQTKAKDGAPMVLAATKKDLINDDATGVVPRRMGEQMAERFGASWMETSAFTGENVNSAFEQICRMILQQKGLAKPAGGDTPGDARVSMKGSTAKLGASGGNVEEKKKCC